MPVIPGTYGGGANTPDPAPGSPFPTLANQMAAYDTSAAIPGRIPGTYGEGANNDDTTPGQPFKVGKFDNGQPAESNFPSRGAHNDAWGYLND